MNIYRTTHRHPCPNGGLIDCYEITIKSGQIIMVEDIVKVLNSAPSPAYQEMLADYLRNTLGAHVTIEGVHHGVAVTTIRE